MIAGYLCATPAMLLLPALTFGFVLGLRHATDADHVAAVGTIVSSGPSARTAAMVGLVWGVGHSISVILAGGALVLLRVPMPAQLALALEFAVAIMLVALGVRSLRRASDSKGGGIARPLVIGLVHGLAGSAVIALLVLGATTSTFAAAMYLLCFGIGTIAGMSVVTALLSLPARLGHQRALRFGRGVRFASGIASVVVGLLLAHRVGIQDGLFGASLFGP